MVLGIKSYVVKLNVLITIVQSIKAKKWVIPRRSMLKILISAVFLYVCIYFVCSFACVYLFSIETKKFNPEL